MTLWSLQCKTKARVFCTDGRNSLRYGKSTIIAADEHLAFGIRILETTNQEMELTFTMENQQRY